MSGHRPFSEIKFKSDEKTYELEKTRLRVNKETWTRVLLDLFTRDKEILLLQDRNDRQAAIIRDQHAIVSEQRQKIETRDFMVTTLQEQMGDRNDGREDVLVFLRSYGYSEPPRLSGRGLAAMVEKHLARNDDIRAAGRAQRDKGTIAGSMSYPETYTTPGRSNGNEDYNLPDAPRRIEKPRILEAPYHLSVDRVFTCPVLGCFMRAKHTHGTEGPEFATMDGK